MSVVFASQVECIFNHKQESNYYFRGYKNMHTILPYLW